MKRSETLAPLSREHHTGLVVALALRRAGADDAGAARERFLAFFESEGRRHFRVEEEILLPAFARHGDARRPEVVRVLADHVEIRSRAAALAADAAPQPDALHELGELLGEHIRHEERVLFPLVEETLPPRELEQLAGAVVEAERAA
jgi:hypothetical protein